jgi:hypothetical protein
MSQRRYSWRPARTSAARTALVFDLKAGFAPESTTGPLRYLLQLAAAMIPLT